MTMDNHQSLRMSPRDWKSAEEEAEGEEHALLWYYLWELSELYETPLTNKYPRIVEGRQFRMMGDFLSDVREAFVRSGWRPEVRPRDADWSENFNDIEPWGGSNE